MISLAFVRRARLAVALLSGVACTPPAETPGGCRVEASDYCVCCPPSDCRKEVAVCPGGVAGLLALKARNPACAVNPWSEAACRSGIIVSERTSAIGVYVQGQQARIDLSTEQLGALTEQIGKLAR